MKQIPIFPQRSARHSGQRRSDRGFPVCPPLALQEQPSFG